MQKLLDDLAVFDFGEYLYSNDKIDISSIPTKYKIVGTIKECKAGYTWSEAWNERKEKLDLYNTYKYTFVNHDGQYYFDSFELPKQRIDSFLSFFSLKLFRLILYSK